MNQLPQIIDDQIASLESALNLQFDEVRKDVLKDNSSFDLQACPGSGKTTLLAAKLILLAQQWPWKYRGVCVLSHTNVARDEIVKKLQLHPSGHEFLSYPHFIGTIQEFVNKFLGIPYVRNHAEWTTGYIDNELFDRKAKAKLSQGTRTYLQNKHIDSLYSLSYSFNGTELQTNIPGFNGISSSPSYTNLQNVRSQLSAEGYFLYSDMYAFAEALLAQSPSVVKSLQHRFPIVLMDEMQDANKQQDELLQKIFPLNSQGIIIQRFGDPDQAIFEFGEPNESYNQLNNIFKYTICNSHRFGDDIAGKIKGLSSNKVALEAVSNSTSPKNHTIILYDDNTQISVLDAFIETISEIFDDHNGLCVKAIGAVAKQNSNAQGGRTNVAIPDYWETYSKPINQARYTPKSLYEAISLVHIKTSITDLAPKYNLLIEALLELLYIADKKFHDGKRYTKTKLYADLEENGHLSSFQQTLWNWLFQKPSSETEWKASVDVLLQLPPFNTISNAHDFLAFNQQISTIAQANLALDTNVYRNEHNIPVHVSTIHAVKGETHDATLVLETKSKKVFDIQRLLGNLVDDNKAAPTCEDLKRMKTLYVACSRAKSMLCLAMHKDKVLPAMQQKGWKVIDITTQNEQQEPS